MHMHTEKHLSLWDILLNQMSLYDAVCRIMFEAGQVTKKQS